MSALLRIFTSTNLYAFDDRGVRFVAGVSKRWKVEFATQWACRQYKGRARVPATRTKETKIYG
jgi:hypothetical protein